MDKTNLDEVLENDKQFNENEYEDCFNKKAEYPPIRVELVKDGLNVSNEEKERLIVDKQIEKMEQEIQHLGDYAKKNHIKGFVMILKIVLILVALAILAFMIFCILYFFDYSSGLINNIIQICK